MKLRAALALTSLAIACGAEAGTRDPSPASPPVAAVPPRSSQTPTGAAMEPVYQDLPDDHWRHAATVAFTALNATLTQMAAARVVLRPWRSPDGAAVPYLVRVEATKADGSPSTRVTAIVSGDKLLNGGRAAAATAVLAGAGFPARPVAIGHLLDILYLTGAVEPGWMQPPSVVGWNAVAVPSPAMIPPPVLESHGASGAVLHLHRAISSPAGSPPGGGVTLPSIERLDVSFDAKAAFTTAVLRKNPAGAWQPYTP